jgi:iron complex outermembrane receptor protein
MAEGTNQPQETTTAVADLKDLSVEDLLKVEVPTVYGASKHDQKVTEAPSSVSIITAEDIKDFGYRTLGDALNSVRGIYVTSDGDYNHIGVNGVNRPGDYGGRVLINIDGHRLNEPLYDSAFSSTDFLLDMDLVERVEVIRGPGSSLYGDNAFFAVINVITKKGGDINGLETSGSYGEFNTLTGRATYGKKFTNGVELLVSGTCLYSNGRDRVFIPAYGSVNGGYADSSGRTKGEYFFSSLGYEDFTLEAGYGKREKLSALAENQVVFDDNVSKNTDERAYAELRFEHEFAGDWLLQARGYLDHYHYGGISPYNYAGSPPDTVTINRENDQAEWVGEEVDVSKTFWENQRISAGVEARQDIKLQMLNYDVYPFALYQGTHTRDNTTGIYAQDECSILTNLILNAGIRYDNFSAFGDTINPRAALIYSPWKEGTWKLIYGSAFRAPNVYEQFGGGITYEPNPGLKPETIHSYELDYEQGLPAGLRFSGSLYLEQIHSLIGQAIDPSTGLYYFANIDSVDAKGFQAELQGHWENGWRSTVSYSYSQTRNVATGAILSNSPRHLGKLNTVIPLWSDKLCLGVEFQAMSSRQTLAGNTVGPVGIVNTTLYSRHLLPNLELSASIYNLFNDQYADPASKDYTEDTTPDPGRTFRVKVIYTF